MICIQGARSGTDARCTKAQDDLFASWIPFMHDPAVKELRKISADRQVITTSACDVLLSVQSTRDSDVSNSVKHTRPRWRPTSLHLKRLVAQWVDLRGPLLWYRLQADPCRPPTMPSNLRSWIG